MKKTKLFSLVIIVFSLAFVYNCNNENITSEAVGESKSYNPNKPTEPTKKGRADPIIMIEATKNNIPAGTNIPFRDHFDGRWPTPNSFWQLCYSNNANNATSAWNRFFKNTKNYECVRVEDSYLKLTAKKEKGPAGLNYKTGGVWSLNNRFGIGTSLKVRAKLYQKNQPNKFYVASAFPAIWYHSLFSSWPTEGEIDIMEWVNVSPEHSYSTIHYQNGSYHTTSKINVAEWHVYRCDLYKDNIVIYYDNNEVFRYTKNPNNHYPFNDNYYNIILNASLQGTWGTAVERDDSNLPYELWIDWVEVSLIDKITGKPL